MHNQKDGEITVIVMVVVLRLPPLIEVGNMAVDSSIVEEEEEEEGAVDHFIVDPFEEEEEGIVELVVAVVMNDTARQQ